jgi:hypothetical protein
MNYGLEGLRPPIGRLFRRFLWQGATAPVTTRLLFGLLLIAPFIVFLVLAVSTASLLCYLLVVLGFIPGCIGVIFLWMALHPAKYCL